MSSHVLKFTPRTTNMLQQVIKSYFNKGGMNVQQLKVKSYLNTQENIGYSKEATYQVLGMLQTCALLRGTQRVEESNLLHEHTNTKKHPVVLKYYRKEHLHSMVM